MEKSHKLEGFLISLGIHAGLLLVLFLIILKPHDPPFVSFGGEGVVLNIGDIYAGTGDPTNLSPTDLNASTNAESNPEENLIAENASLPVPEEEDLSTNDDPESVEIEKVKPKETTKTDIKTAEKTDNNNNNTSNNTANNTKVNQQKVDNNALFPGGSKKAGDDNNKAGDPGNPKGVDPNSLYKDGTAGNGKGGAGDGVGISIGGGISGWAYNGDPLPKDESQEKGTLEYRIYVNDDGSVTNVVPLRNLGISPKTEKLYREQLYKLVFDPVGNVPPVTEGIVSYKINVK